MLHEISTNGHRAYCVPCQKSFSSKWHLSRHEDQVHAIGNNYKCVKCEKSFLTELKLKKHMRSHSATGSGEHECEVCQKWFPSSSNLILHRNIHLEEKPFKCDYCDKGFNQRGNLKVHLQKYHNKELGAVLSESFNNIHVGEANTMKVRAIFQEILKKVKRRKLKIVVLLEGL